MKILHVNTNERAGGAAIAANRLHKGLQTVGVDSQLFVALNETDDTSVHKAYGRFAKVLRPFRQFPDYILPRLYRSRGSTLFSPQLTPSLVHNAINSLHPDVIHIHWTADSFLPILSMAKLKAPVVWTLHDTWPFTGGCHYPSACTRYHNSCGKCSSLGSHRNCDLSKLGWKLKKKVYASLQPHIIGLSKDFIAQIKSSSLLEGFPTTHLPNGISTSTFFPFSQKIARTLLGLPQNSKLILFGAMSASTDFRKGYDLLKEALGLLKKHSSESLHCVVFGASSGEKLPFPTHYLGALHDDVALNLVYNAADVFVCPSREESFSLTTLEALSCGTPVVAFPVGGIPDMVSHMNNGYLATSYNTEQLALGLKTIIEDHSLRQKMSVSARKTVVDCYRIELIAARYKDLYESVLRIN